MNSKSISSLKKKSEVLIKPCDGLVNDFGCKLVVLKHYMSGLLIKLTKHLILRFDLLEEFARSL